MYFFLILLRVFWIYFCHLTHFFYHLFILYVAHVFLSNYLFFFCPVHCITFQNAKKKTNPKSKLQNPDQKARLPWGKRKSFVPKGLPLILMKKLGCLPHVFCMCFPVIKAALFFFVRFIGFPITSQNAKKEKSREFPLGGPSPCGKQD